MKISIVTAVFNRVKSIAQTIESVRCQSYKNTEHLVIDGASTDGTLEVIESCGKLASYGAHKEVGEKFILVSEPDEGIYDALNKGLARSTGQVVGLLHSDDIFADSYVLEDIAAAFADQTIDAVYGDLDYVSKDDVGRVVRHWHSGEYNPLRLRWGWMPPHPTLFLRRQVIENWGGFDTRFQIAADYDAILRYFGVGKIRATYIPRVLVKMRMGGESNRSLSQILRKSAEDYAALRRNRVGGIGALTWKNLSKLTQFIKH